MESASVASTALAVANRDWRLRLLAWYVRRRARFGLDGVYVAGLDTAAAAATTGPVLFACTHHAWWDGLLLRLVELELGLDGRIVMDGDTLAQNPYFRWFGALPLYPGLAARSGLRRVVAHLDRPGKAAWYFAQGRHRAQGLRPLGLLPGVETLARMGDFQVVPVSLLYAFRLAPVPAAIIVFGPPVEARTAALEQALVAGLDRAERWIDGESDSVRPLVPPGVVPTEEGPAAKLLRWMTR